VSTLGLAGSATDQDNQPSKSVFLTQRLLGQGEKVSPVAAHNDSDVLLRVLEDVAIRSSDGKTLADQEDIVPPMPQHSRDLRGHVVIEQEPHTSRPRLGQLFRDECVDFRPMILVVGQALVNLGPREIRETAEDILDTGAVDDQPDDIVHANARAFDNRAALAYAGHVNEVTVGRRNHGGRLRREPLACKPSIGGSREILTITEPAQLVPLGPREFRIRCCEGMQFEVQRSADLQPWNSLGAVTNETGTLTFQDTQGEAQTAACFYRVVPW